MLVGGPEQPALCLTQRAEDRLSAASLQVVRAARHLAGVALDLVSPRLALVEGITRRKGGPPSLGHPHGV